MPPAPTPKGSPSRVRIGFPVHCRYRGGHSSLGRHGRGFRIQEGRIGYGTYRLAHSIPITEVEGVEVTERQFGGTEATTLFSMGDKPGVGPGSAPKQMTDITVRMRDGQEAL